MDCCSLRVQLRKTMIACCLPLRQGVCFFLCVCVGNELDVPTKLLFLSASFSGPFLSALFALRFRFLFWSLCVSGSVRVYGLAASRSKFLFCDSCRKTALFV